ncbi:MAG: tRNA 2-thiouridine(34) synthase MnmA [bacterium]|nr:tRNA 2-thiouridine(34) synthase MnmA [bacterium]
MNNKTKQKIAKKIVFVGMSGGVDSSVSAAILKKKGYDVVGVFIRTWHPDFIECNEEEEKRDAMRVCAYLDIPFVLLDLEDVYKKKVADYMISEYKLGRTPNPDIMCNSEVKFGAFLDFAISKGADYVATGHYAEIYPHLTSPYLGGGSQKSFLVGGGMYLKKSPDPTKDQSYFLYKLTQEQLSTILFPIGHLYKKQVRGLARKYKLPVAEKKDSQGICFLGEIDLKDFLKHYIEEKRGEVKNEKGEVIGHHDGVVFITLGARHGFTITVKTPDDKPYYVVAKDVQKNILHVSQKKNLKNSPAFALGGKKTGDQRLLNFSNSSLRLTNCNWISETPQEKQNYTAQIRYHGEFLPCQIKNIKGATSEIIFKNPQLIAPGQSVVLYYGDTVLGGGVVQ